MSAPPFTITTERLVLDPLTLDDAATVAVEWSVEPVARMTATVDVGWSETQARDWLAPRIEDGEDGLGRAIRLRDTGRLVGWVGMGGDPVNLGYMLAEPFWGQGYASEAVGAFLEAVLTGRERVQAVEAGVFHDNPASARILQKLGFVAVGDAGCQSLARCDATGSTLYRLTRETWEAAR